MKADQRDRFEDRLLAELKQVVAERPVPESVPEVVPRRFSWKPKLAMTAAAAAAGVAAAIALPLAFGPAEQPAHAVTVQDDGKVRVEIYELKDPEGLERKLKKAGIPAEVDFIPVNKACREPRYEPSDTEVGGQPEQHDDKTILVIDPEPLREGETVVLTTFVAEEGDRVAAGAITDVAKGPVAPCELVDSPWPAPHSD